MTTQTFTWLPEYGVSLSQNPNVSVTKFGDGYEARTPIGINNAPEIWTLNYTKATVNLLEITQFIQARNATEAFFWKNPMGNTNLYVCRKWKVEHRGEVRIMNFEFEQVFGVY